MENRQGEKFFQKDAEAMAEVWRQLGDDLTLSMRGTAKALGLPIEPQLERSAREAEKRNKQRRERLKQPFRLDYFSPFE